RRLDLPRLALELGGVGADLLGLAGEALQFLHPDRLAGDDARYERAGGGGADIGRKALLDQGYELVAGDHAAPPALVLEEVERLDGPEHTIGDLAQFRNPGGAADDAQLALRLAPEDIDEQGRLEPREGRRLAQQRDRHQEH